MGIFLLKNIFGEYKNIKPAEQDEQRRLVDNYGHPLKEGWKPITFKWDCEDGDKPRDLFLYLGSILICNKKSIMALEDAISNAQIEILPIFIENDEFYVMNVCTSLNDALDIKKSKVEYFKDKSIKWISEYVFSSNCNDSQIFHIPEIQSPIFVSDAFVECVRNSGLVGLKFEECKHGKSSFLKSIFK